MFHAGGGFQGGGGGYEGEGRMEGKLASFLETHSTKLVPMGAWMEAHSCCQGNCHDMLM